jgi:oligosaccharyltransferase complex subunit gamma
MHRSNKGISYIHGSSSGQFVIETYIIIALNGAVALGVILMNEAMKGGKSDVKTRKVTAFIGIGLTVVFFSLLLSIFRGKAHGYPYSFLFK